MSKTAGYIVEFLYSNGELEILSRDYQRPELNIVKSKLDQHPIVKKETPEIKLQYKLDKATNQAVYRYKGRRELRPHWINVVVLPDDYLYITYLANLPNPKPKWKSSSKDFPFHIGNSFYLTNHNQLCLFYINPNKSKSYTISNQMDITHFKNTEQIKNTNMEYFEFKNILGHEYPNLLDKTIEQATKDRKDNELKKQKIELSNQRDVICHFHIANPKNLIKALERIEYIKVTKGGGSGHQYKATNTKNNRSAPIPWHKELDHAFPKKLAKQLGIPYDVLLSASL